MLAPPSTQWQENTNNRSTYRCSLQGGTTDSVHKTVGDKWPAPARRLTQTHLSAAAQNTGDQKSLSLFDDKQIDLFLILGEERRKTRATSRRSRTRVHLISSRPSLTFFTLSRHVAGSPSVDFVSRSKAYRRVRCYRTACGQLSTYKHKFRRVQPRQKLFFEVIFNVLSCYRRTRVFPAEVIFLKDWTENLATSCCHYHYSEPEEFNSLKNKINQLSMHKSPYEFLERRLYIVFGVCFGA